MLDYIQAIVTVADQKEIAVGIGAHARGEVFSLYLYLSFKTSCL